MRRIYCAQIHCAIAAFFFFFDLDVCFFLAFSLMQFFVTFSEIHLFLLATRKFILILFGTHINIEVLRTMAAATKK